MKSKSRSQNHESLGAYLKAHRENANLTQNQLALDLKLKSPQLISNIERDVAFPSKRILIRLIGRLDLDADLVAHFYLRQTHEKVLREFRSAKLVATK